MEYENDFFVMVDVMALYEEHFVSKISHFEEYIGYWIEIIQTKVLKNKEIKPIHDPICPPLGANGRWKWLCCHGGSYMWHM